MICKKATGDYDTFARKNNLSKSGLTKVINEMKALGFPIKYDKNRRSYIYEKEGQMTKHLFWENHNILSRDQLKELKPDMNDFCFSETSIFEPCKDFI
jgi:hypothetical protein